MAALALGLLAGSVPTVNREIVMLGVLEGDETEIVVGGGVKFSAG